MPKNEKTTILCPFCDGTLWKPIDLGIKISIHCPHCKYSGYVTKITDEEYSEIKKERDRLKRQFELLKQEQSFLTEEITNIDKQIFLQDKIR
jgi:phage FluMu protein Com